MGFIAVGDKKVADTTPDMTPYALKEDVEIELGNVVAKTDIAKEITVDSTDEEVASAKAVYDSLLGKADTEALDDYAKTETVGDLTELKTTDKSSLVAAINENNVNLGELESALDDKANGKILSWRSYNASTQLKEALNANFSTIQKSGVYSVTFAGGVVVSITVGEGDNGDFSIITNNTFTGIFKTFYYSNGAITEKQEFATMDKVVKATFVPFTIVVKSAEDAEYTRVNYSVNGNVIGVIPIGGIFVTNAGTILLPAIQSFDNNTAIVRGVCPRTEQIGDGITLSGTLAVFYM